MIFTTQLPGPELRELIDWYWFYEGLSPAHSLERVLPEGTFELVINLRSEARHVFARDDHRPLAEYRRAWLSGAHARHIVIDTAPESSMIGVHFKPGGAARLLGVPATEFSDQVVELDGVWGLAGWDLRDALLEVPTPAAKFALLEQFLRSCARRSPRRQRNHDRAPAIGHVLRRLTADPSTLSIASLAEESGISHKQFIERFRAAVGLTPKRFCRIRRFREVLQAIQASRGFEWADLAASCGYYDQAHFIHEFQEFSGLNPSGYLKQRGDYIGYVPVPLGGIGG